MRKKILFLAVLLMPVFLSAQKAKVWNKPLYDSYPYHFGFGFGFGMLDFSVRFNEQFAENEIIYSVEGVAGPSGAVSMVSNLRLSENFDLRFTPGMLFGQRNLKYWHKKLIPFDTVGKVELHNMTIETAYVQFPLGIKYRAVRENNYRPYVYLGFNYVIDLASRKKIKEEERPKIRLHRHDILLEAGFGVDNYLPFFKFTTELRFSYGLFNIVNYDNTPYTDGVFDKLGTKKVSLIIFFE